jgi:hypothetical protein
MRSPSGLTVERAKPADGPAVEALLDAAAAWQESRGVPMWTAGQFVDEVHETIATGELFVARRDGALVGCFLLDARDPQLFSRWAEEQGLAAVPGASLELDALYDTAATMVPGQAMPANARDGAARGSKRWRRPSRQ